MRAAALLAVVVISAIGLGAAGCGAASRGADQAPQGTPVPARAATGVPLLAASQLPRLRAVTRSLGVAGVAQATPIPGLGSLLAAWGVRSAWEREFTGSRGGLSHVVSMGVDFAGATGAARYERLLLTRAATFLGAGAAISRLRTARGTGWMIQAQSCGCHPVPPTVVAVIRHRTDLAWISVTGAAATAARLRALAGHLTNPSQPL